MPPKRAHTITTRRNEANESKKMKVDNKDVRAFNINSNTSSCSTKKSSKHSENITINSKKRTTSYPKEIDRATNQEQSPEQISYTAKLPTRNKKGELVFEAEPDFRPNLTPKEVLQAGSFGGTYFRPIKSSVTGKSYSGVWKELPKEWLEGLNIKKQVSSLVYDESVNTYKEKCGGSLEMWESSGWIHKQDPYGWFQWYSRYYQGRRTPDDRRQIGRWLRCAGPTGRWRCNLISKCLRSTTSYNNVAVSPVVRQTLQHWAYKLCKDDFELYKKKVKK